MFYDDFYVMYILIYRYDDGIFFFGIGKSEEVIISVLMNLVLLIFLCDICL